MRSKFRRTSFYERELHLLLLLAAFEDIYFKLLLPYFPLNIYFHTSVSTLKYVFENSTYGSSVRCASRIRSIISILLNDISYLTF